MATKKDTQSKQIISYLERIERQHPYIVMMYAALVGIAAMFLLLLFAFQFYNQKEGLALSEYGFPMAFMVSTCAILLSSLTLHQAKLSFYEDDFLQMRRYLRATLGLGVAFAASQVYGWIQLHSAGVELSSGVSGTFLYIMSGLHIIHFLGGLIFLAVQYVKINRIHHDPVKVLIAVTNPYEKMKLTLLLLYWHFMDALWIVLFLYFTFSFLI